MLLKTVQCMMSIYTTQCKLFGTYSAQEYACRQLHAQNATRFLQLRNQFVNQKSGNVLKKFMKSAAILFYVNYTAVPVHSNNLCTHDGNNETQSLVDTDDDVSFSSSTVSSLSSKQRQNKSTYETAQAASICM